MRRATSSAARVSATAAVRRVSSPEAFEKEPTHAARCASTIGACTECSSSRVSGSQSPSCAIAGSS